MQKQSGSLGKGWGNAMPNSSGNVALHPSLASASTQGTQSAPVRTDPPADVLWGFITQPCSPRLRPGHPQLPDLFSSPSPMCFLFLLQTAYAKPDFTAGSAPRVCFLCLCGARQLRLRRGSEVEAVEGGESRGGGEGNGSGLLLSKPLFV